MDIFPLEPWRTPGFLEERHGHLTMDGHDLADLAARHGTPLVVYSERRLRANAAALIRDLGAAAPKAQVFYAAKACSAAAVLRIMREAGCGIEVNSGGELHLARQAGFADDAIVFNGVAKTEGEISSSFGIKAINVDSLFELERIVAVARRQGRRAAVALRAIPNLSGGTSPGNETGGSASKFGMTAEEIDLAIRISSENYHNIKVVGVHVHVGSQIQDAAIYGRAADFAAALAGRAEAALGYPIEHVNLGGGFPIDYVKSGSQHLETGYFRPGTLIFDIARGVAASGLSARTDLEVLFEPGRAMVGDTAVLLATVLGAKKRDVPWLYVDTGYHHLIEQFSYTWYYHAVSATDAAPTTTSAFRLFGPLCDSGDAFHDVVGEGLAERLAAEAPDLAPLLRRALVRLPRHRELPAATKAGDVLAFLDVGAYTLETMSANNGHLRPAVLMIKADGSIEVMRRRDTVADL